MGLFHPRNPVSGLDMNLSRCFIGIIQRRGLNIDQTRQIDIIAVKQPRSALDAEVPPCILRRGIDTGIARNAQLIVLDHKPSDHGCAAGPATICAMAQSMAHWLTRNLIADRAAMAASIEHEISPCFAPDNR